MCKTLAAGRLAAGRLAAGRLAAGRLAAATLGALMLALALSPAPAAAKHYRGGLDAYQARDIAFGLGIVEIKEMELDDRKWEIEGYDEGGREIEVKLDARDGRILKIDRD